MVAQSLRAYLARKKAAMAAAAAQKPRGDDWRETVEAVCVADDDTGVRKLRIRDWAFVSDSGPSFGGGSAGPSSPEMLCGVVSTCLTHMYLIGAAHLDVPLDRVEVRVTAQNNDARLLGLTTSDPALPFALRAEVKLEAPDATPAQVSKLHRYAEDCPLTQLIRNSNPLVVVTD